MALIYDSVNFETTHDFRVEIVVPPAPRLSVTTKQIPGQSGERLISSRFEKSNIVVVGAFVGQAVTHNFANWKSFLSNLGLALTVAPTDFAAPTVTEKNLQLTQISNDTYTNCVAVGSESLEMIPTGTLALPNKVKITFAWLRPFVSA